MGLDGGLIGDDDAGCFAASWSARSDQPWTEDLRYGSECHARAVLVDADGNAYALATTVSGGVSDATLWKIDRRGQTAWTYRPSGPAGWVYSDFDVDSSGRAR